MTEGWGGLPGVGAGRGATWAGASGGGGRRWVAGIGGGSPATVAEGGKVTGNGEDFEWKE